MKLADKIIMLRRKNGWSQEELAEKLDVSRQSVSKWEGDQSVPELTKIIRMSEIFGVSTDFLLKDELDAEDAPAKATETPDEIKLRQVSNEDAGEFIELRRKAAPMIATATLLCILSPVCLLILAVAADLGMWGITEHTAAGIGLAALILTVAVACVMFVTCGMRSAPYEFLENEDFTREQGVTEAVTEKKKRFSPAYLRFNTIAVFVVILAAIPLLSTAVFTEDEFLTAVGLCTTLLLVGIAVWLFIYAGVIEASYRKLLCEGEYKASAKSRGRMGAFSTAYWLTVTAAFLALGFVSEEWHMTALIWPVAGVFYGGLCAAFSIFKKDD